MQSETFESRPQAANRGAVRHVGGITGEPVERRGYNPVVRPESTESFWRALVEYGRPEFQIERITEARIRWPKGLRQIRLEGRDHDTQPAQGGNWFCRSRTRYKERRSRRPMPPTRSARPSSVSW